ncbi:MAG: valine--pyruvate aminotransferase [Oleiphilaceae bacterium]|jgi:valine--pyruvate aminotransferase
MKLSNFGEKFTSQAGITSLMDDLGNALASGANSSATEMIMMGGGNPAHIPEIQAVFKERLSGILNSKQDFQRLIGIYDPPQGNIDFVNAISKLLNDQYGWGLGPENIALTNGSQAAFFMLFNMFAGEFEDGSKKQIQLPLAPEYIGYADAGLNHNFFKANRPSIEYIDSHTFKYHIDFDKINASPDAFATTGAICVSRPTNPTGNVLTDGEISHLDALAKQHDVPFIIDGAYGTPFPNLIFTQATPVWNDNTILCLSLSKFGLPAARTGIVIADEKVIKALSGVNAIMNLATGSFGSMLAHDLVKSKEIIRLSDKVVRPYYLEKAHQAEALLREKLQGLPFALHKVEGAMFLWLWLKGCPVSSQKLYERLKEKGVLIVSGHHFFPGLDSPEDINWAHRNECLRITYSQDDVLVQKGLTIIAKEIHLAYQV